MRELKGILYPYCYQTDRSDGAEADVYTISDLPEQFTEKYRRLDEAVLLPEFPLRARVLAALNLADTMVGIQDKFEGLLYSMRPGAVYVNLETGETKILIERCMDFASGKEGRYEYGFAVGPKEEKEDTLTEADLLNFLEYTTFRLLCMEDPFDGEETLTRYPCLTRKALEEIHRGDYPFAFAGAGHPAAAYPSQNAQARWKSLPGDLRRLFERVFDRSARIGEDGMDLSKWRIQMRKLRDCLVSVNRQFRLCDPEVPNKVLFLVIGEYRIPVWSKKAIYWYHTKLEYEKTTNGLVGGINSEGSLENRTGTQWAVELDGTTAFIAPGGKVKLEEGMKLTIGKEVVRIVNGETQAADPEPSVDGLDLGLTIPDLDGEGGS